MIKSSLFFLFIVICIEVSAQSGVLNVYTDLDSASIVTEQRDTIPLLANQANRITVERGEQRLILICEGYLPTSQVVTASRVTKSVYFKEHEQLVSSENWNYFLLEPELEISDSVIVTGSLATGDSRTSNSASSKGDDDTDSHEFLENANLYEANYYLEKFMKDNDFIDHEGLTAFSRSDNNYRISASITRFKIRYGADGRTLELDLLFSLQSMGYDLIDTMTVRVQSEKFNGWFSTGELARTTIKGLNKFLSDSTIVHHFLKEPDEVVDPVEKEKRILTPGDTSETLIEASKFICTVLTSDGHGSGCLISRDGYLFTNAHVVGKEKEVVIDFGENDTISAEVIDVDWGLDAALLKVDSVFENCLVVASNKDMSLGTTLFTIGSPLDVRLFQSISKGILSAKVEIKGRPYYQTDARVNGGNSGGALMNAQNQLVGVVNAKIVGWSMEGIGFAIPVEYVLRTFNIEYK